MNIKLDKKILSIAVVLGLIIVAIFLSRSVTSLNPVEKHAEQALLFLNDKETSLDASGLFDTDFLVGLLSNYSYYSVDKWDLSSEKISDTRYIVTVEGTATNAFNATLERKFDLIIEKPSSFWYVTDSYGLFDLDRDLGVSLADKSDLEIHNLWTDSISKMEIEDWSFSLNRYGSVEGEGTIYNGSEIPIEYVKLKVSYFDDADNQTNSDWSYAVSGNALRPGQRRNFSWITSNCYNCSKATVDLSFE